MLILRWLIMSLAVILSTYLIPGVKVSGLWSAMLVAFILGIVNVFVRPLLLLITLPVNILTLGLFSFVINGLMVMLVSSIVKGFSVDNFWVAILFSIILSVSNYILSVIFGIKK